MIKVEIVILMLQQDKIDTKSDVLENIPFPIFITDKNVSCDIQPATKHFNLNYLIILLVLYGLRGHS